MKYVKFVRLVRKADIKIGPLSVFPDTFFTSNARTQGRAFLFQTKVRKCSGKNSPPLPG